MDSSSDNISSGVLHRKYMINRTSAGITMQQLIQAYRTLYIQFESLPSRCTSQDSGVVVNLGKYVLIFYE
jgi:hypothetical protein